MDHRDTSAEGINIQKRQTVCQEKSAARFLHFSIKLDWQFRRQKSYPALYILALIKNCTQQPHNHAQRRTHLCRNLSHLSNTWRKTWHKAWHTGHTHYCNAKLPVAKETCGRGRIPCCCYSSQISPCQLSPLGRKKRQKVGGEVGRGRGQQFNGAMRCRGTSLAINVHCTHQCAPWMPTHMLHFSSQTSTYPRKDHGPPSIHTPIQRRRIKKGAACLEWKA